MEFIELADYPVSAGRVVEWQPTARTHWADWPRDSRAVSYNHEHHLRDALEHSRIRDRRAYWLGNAFRIEGPLDTSAWQHALDTLIDRHESLRSHVTIEGGRPARYTQPPGEIRVRPVDAGSTASTMATYRLVERLLDEGTTPTRWPAYVCVTIENRGGFTVLIAADHSLVDGYSTGIIGSELPRLYAAAVTGEDTLAPQSESGGYLDYCHGERAFADAATVETAGVRIWREFFDEADDGSEIAPATGPLAPTAPFSRVAARPVALREGTHTAPRVPQRTLAIEVLDADAADLAGAAAREKRQGLFAVLLAAFAATATEYGAGRDFRTVVPLHTRYEERWAETVGWFVGLTPFHLDTAGARGVAELIAPAGQELRRTRAAAAVPFGRVCELLEVRPRISFMVSYMDVRAIPLARTWVDSDTRWLRSRNVSDNEFYFWFIRTPTGVTLNMRYPGTARATRDIHRHVLRMRELLADYVRFGDATIRPIEGAPLSWR
ncbi:condensation protein [Nocardia panacis]|uniref:Condensation protein n=1 Tax=Nocardia panacis TaxID=2340916 RepID=A0A3A4JYD2_9NOCA|nr:condensation domain-containing protein [Nocardia panacis]RJO68173.1 condensation protein [Nocardia panacis]